MILLCVRHGETTYNAQGRIQGQLDTPLSPLGHLQSQALATALARLPIEAVYASPLRRAMDTAVPIAEAAGLAVRADDRLKELHAGVFQDLLPEEMERRYPLDAARWRSLDPDFRIPGGESRRDLAERGLAAIEAIRGTGHAYAVVVSHGGLLTAVLKALLGVPPDRHPFMLFNASISRLQWSSSVRLLTLNELEHLRTDGFALESRTGDL